MGEIDHLLLSYDTMESYPVIDKNYFKAVESLLTNLPNVKFTVIVSGEGKKRFEAFLQDLQKNGKLINPDRIQLVLQREGCSIKFQMWKSRIKGLYSGVKSLLHSPLSRAAIRDRIYMLKRDVKEVAPLSNWAQDSVLVKGDTIYRQDRRYFPGVGDRYMAETAAKALPDFDYGRLKGIYVDGGNSLSTQKDIMIGVDSLEEMVKSMRPWPKIFYTIRSKLTRREDDPLQDKERVRKSMLKLQNTFPTQRVLIIGEKIQPAFHIDMTVTPLAPSQISGKPVALVGDPRWGADLLEKLRKSNPSAYAAYQKKISSQMVQPISDPLGKLERVNRNQERLEHFAKTARELENAGYEVHRIPYLGEADRTEGIKPEDVYSPEDLKLQREKGREEVGTYEEAPTMTYNNALLDGSRVFMPTYGIPEIDGEAAEVYRQMGYQVLPVEMVGLTQWDGAIHCIVKVLRKKNI